MDEVQELININRKHSALFISSRDERLRYRGEHATEIAALKCMDGRINLPVITKTPLGIIQPFRNLGGEFDFGWPYFGELIKDWVNYGLGRGRHCILLVTYHFARNEKHRGCRGFNYDVDAAQKFTANLCTKFGELHPSKNVVRAVQWGIDTDTDAILLHGDNSEVLDVGELSSDVSNAFLLSKLQELYLDMPERMIQDLLPLVRGNIDHVAEIGKIGRTPEEADHREWVIGIGRGFDWLHLPNTALIVGPFSPNLNAPIATAAGIIQSNIEEGRIPKDKSIVLLSSASFRDSADLPYMVEKARFLSKFALDTIQAQPDLQELQSRLHLLTVTVNMDTRLFDIIER